jgi:hypothetical protein
MNYPFDGDGYLEDEAFDALEERLNKMTMKVPNAGYRVSESIKQEANPHYDAGGIKTIDFIKAKLSKEQFIGFLLGNVLKYGARMNHKGVHRQDVGKMEEYSRWLREIYNEG